MTQRSELQRAAEQAERNRVRQRQWAWKWFCRYRRFPALAPRKTGDSQ